MWGLYQLLFLLALGVAGPVLLVRRGSHYLATLAGRFGAHRGAGARGALWIHAVSVGEVGVATTLARALPGALPLVVTTITPTGQERAHAELGGRAAVAYHPFELGFALARFFRRFAPRALVLCEGDLWPLALRETKRRGLPVVVVNGRVSDRAYPRLHRWRRPLGRLLLARIDHFGVQTPLDRDRLLALGVAAERVTVTGNLKFEAAAPAGPGDAGRLVERLAAGRPVLVAGSTMPGEEPLVLDAFAAAGGGRRALLVLAPRHPERFGDVFELVRARYPDAVRRSAAAPGATPAVLLLDSLGELAGLYGLARGAFVGGTLVPRGGHNPIEPARAGVPVAVGPSMDNFRDIADAFLRAAACRQVADPAALGACLAGWLDDPAAAAAEGARARALVEQHRGALARTLALLGRLVETVPEPAA
jgi:3-deoxy-D-manno-octulosonic-acid transferase